MTNRLTLLVFLCALLAAAPAAAKTYYKWTDDNGTVHYTADPPEDRDYETIDTSGQITGRSDDQARPAPAESAKDAEDAEQVQMPRQAAPDPEVVAARCEQARENLFWLQSKRRIIVEDDEGGETFASPEEQQRLIEENQALIDEWCQD